jgi:CheY-like chemotaxis protein
VTVPISRNHPGPVVLAVDDYELNAELMPVLLEPLGAQVVTASSGRQALTLCNAHRFDLILIDVRLPDIDGRKLATLLRQSLLNMETPTLFVTGDDVVAEAMIAQGVDILLKPYRAATLLAKVSTFLGAHRAA